VVSIEDLEWQHVEGVRKVTNMVVLEIVYDEVFNIGAASLGQISKRPEACMFVVSTVKKHCISIVGNQVRSKTARDIKQTNSHFDCLF
jgi:hypothetical protein